MASRQILTEAFLNIAVIQVQLHSVTHVGEAVPTVAWKFDVGDLSYVEWEIDDEGLHAGVVGAKFCGDGGGECHFEYGSGVKFDFSMLWRCLCERQEDYEQVKVGNIVFGVGNICVVLVYGLLEEASFRTR